MPTQPTRRTFIKASAAATATLPAILPPLVRAESKISRPNIAFIGVNGRGNAHRSMAMNNRVTGKNGIDSHCFCDVDSSPHNLANFKKQFPKSKHYTDSREMFDKEHKNFDAVSIATPDHQHYLATMTAMSLGKHVYCEKPLTHTAWEAREIFNATKKYKVATQMGNQGNAGEGWRQNAAIIASGAIGEIKEVHTWCGANHADWAKDNGKLHTEGHPIPNGLDWKQWLGPAPHRAYRDKQYAPWFWRTWRDFGGGVLADWACHTMNTVFAILKPGHCTSVQCVSSTQIRPHAYNKASILKWVFPEKDGRRAFDSYWYDSGLLPKIPKELGLTRRLPAFGNLFYGTKGVMLVSGSHGGFGQLIPKSRRKEFAKPPRVIESSPGIYDEWLMAVKGDKPIDYPKSNFRYGAHITETALLGNIALRLGRKLDWDGDNFKFTNIPEANQYLSKDYPKGWEFKA